MGPDSGVQIPVNDPMSINQGAIEATNSIIQLAKHPADLSCKLLKLSFDRRFIHHRPYLDNPFSSKFVEHVLGKGDSLPIYCEAKELSLWRTIEEQPARQIGGIGDEQLNVKLEVRDFGKVSLEHLAIAR